jgi:hypothetical protein
MEIELENLRSASLPREEEPNAAKGDRKLSLSQEEFNSIALERARQQVRTFQSKETQFLKSAAVQLHVEFATKTHDKQPQCPSTCHHCAIGALAREENLQDQVATFTNRNSVPTALTEKLALFDRTHHSELEVLRQRGVRMTPDVRAALEEGKSIDDAAFVNKGMSDVLSAAPADKRLAEMMSCIPAGEHDQCRCTDRLVDTRVRVSIEGRGYEGVVMHGLGESGDEGNWWFGVECDDGMLTKKHPHLPKKNTNAGGG